MCIRLDESTNCQLNRKPPIGFRALALLFVIESLSNELCFAVVVVVLGVDDNLVAVVVVAAAVAVVDAVALSSFSSYSSSSS